MRARVFARVHGSGRDYERPVPGGRSPYRDRGVARMGAARPRAAGERSPAGASTVSACVAARVILVAGRRRAGGRVASRSGALRAACSRWPLSRSRGRPRVRHARGRTWVATRRAGRQHRGGPRKVAQPVARLGRELHAQLLDLVTGLFPSGWFVRRIDDHNAWRSFSALAALAYALPARGASRSGFRRPGEREPSGRKRRERRSPQGSRCSHGAGLFRQLPVTPSRAGVCARGRHVVVERRCRATRGVVTARDRAAWLALVSVAPARVALVPRWAALLAPPRKATRDRSPDRSRGRGGR